MPVEMVFFGALVPTLLPVLAFSILLFLLLDKWSSRWNLERWIWHPALFRLSFFVIVFTALALGVYG
ncbi:hypothetical protein B1757_01245 [Acidithiobacillus marinus]|uniref:DUF1656 domain-containing protein n=1 Tax=Acidithiobacillus marinus TaxID=187490 RepID=A0A2I1DQ73_9PROT|nr:DUF1656 domain-containing protein [Acidithiobacillus marinus]PKY12006.1 hypothetical protein B1757_01245 [Acidithiobacillus marinus]